MRNVFKYQVESFVGKDLNHLKCFFEKNGLSLISNNLEEVRSKIQETEFILKHIEKKYAVIIENVF